MKGQALDDLFKFKESEKIEMTTQELLGTKGVPNIRELQYTPWFQKMKQKSTKDFPYVQVVSPNAVFGVSRV